MLTTFKPLKTLELIINEGGIEWLPWIIDLSIEQFTLSGIKLSRNDLL